MSPTIKRDQIAAMNWHYKQYSLDFFFDTVERIGYSAVAFWAGPPHFHIDSYGYQDVQALSRKLRAHHLKCTSFTAAAGHPIYQFGVCGEDHRKQTLNYFTNGAQICADLGVTLMSASSGTGYINEPREEAWARSQDMLFRVSNVCQRLGITLCVESLRPPETKIGVTVYDVKRLLEEVDMPNCKPMIDTTAMAVNHETIWDWFDVFGKDISNMHFVDAAPSGHLAWGDGVLPLEDMLCCINQHGYEGPLGLEITHEQYFKEPQIASERSFRALEHYAEE